MQSTVLPARVPSWQWVLVGMLRVAAVLERHARLARFVLKATIARDRSVFLYLRFWLLQLAPSLRPNSSPYLYRYDLTPQASKEQCPPGTYGSSSQAWTTSACEGQCDAGYFCDAGSKKKNAEVCGKVAPVASYYCPKGTLQRMQVASGFYTTPTNVPQNVRTGMSPCGTTEVCVNGVAQAALTFNDGKCPNFDASVIEGATGETVGTVSAAHNRSPPSSIAYSIVSSVAGDKFQVTSLGLISVKPGVNLDGDDTPTLTFTLRAQAGTDSADVSLLFSSSLFPIHMR